MNSPRPMRHWVLLLAVGLAGCFGGHRREYPSDWPRRVELSGDDCPDLSGVYESAPLPDPFVSKPRPLQALLSPPKRPARAEPKGRVPPVIPFVRLSLDPSAGPLGVAALSAAGSPVTTLRLERGLDFECDGGALEVTLPMEVANANVCAAVSRRQLALSRDTEGALVARSSSQESCFGGFFGSLHFWEADWARFRPSTALAGVAGTAGEPLPMSRKRAPAAARIIGAAWMEVLFAGHSWWASAKPRAAGWVAVIAAPSGLGYDAGAAFTPPAIAVGGAAGVGLYDVYELSKPGYSRNDRFLRTFAAWNVVALTTVTADWLIGGPRPAGAPAVAVVPVDGGAVLVLAVAR